MGRQDVADALDAEMARRMLPPQAVQAAADWLARSGAGTGGADGHGVRYLPARWAAIGPWPGGFAARTGSGTAVVSRAQVVAAVGAAAGRGAWAEALVASYVWGQGRTGYGPHRLGRILAEPRTEDRLARAAGTLLDRGAVAAYREVDRAVKGLGPAFFTKYLYFVDRALGPAPGFSALILDQRVARVLRARATRVGTEAALPSAGEVARWTWSDTGWTAHRYEVYLRWMHAAAEQLARAVPGWPAGEPDLWELALFQGGWDPAG
ncbi:hypothetical protein GCM10010441_72030 [Kitasatospora paracochleata]|uniref:Uncharacterized protein n=1 Tax=Kitasatospora paracochleata TaxID=58354 RepID=A0ABT1J5T0_9ACTN|nr:hypothetical protein [Kitasatospora paracochleata]MCP2312589.1 hypothetical protein [Kitasatospora paracochleata]